MGCLRLSMVQQQWVISWLKSLWLRHNKLLLQHPRPSEWTLFCRLFEITYWNIIVSILGDQKVIGMGNCVCVQLIWFEISKGEIRVKFKGLHYESRYFVLNCHICGIIEYHEVLCPASSFVQVQTLQLYTIFSLELPIVPICYHLCRLHSWLH